MKPSYKLKIRKINDEWVIDILGGRFLESYVQADGTAGPYCGYKNWNDAIIAHDLYLKKKKDLALQNTKNTPVENRVMTLERFDTLLDYIVTERIKKTMCNKSAEYASGQNKLHNFDHASQMRGITPMEALRGMKLKHEVSIEDMLNGLKEGKTYSRELWEEKFTDNINYQILQWAILARDNNWR